MLPNRLLLGAEVDATFPGWPDLAGFSIGGTSNLTSPGARRGNLQRDGARFRHVRGRIGYAPDNWLFTPPAVGLELRPIHPLPAGGTAPPGTSETVLMQPRAGWTLGAGVEFARIALDRAGRISVHRLRHPERPVSGRRAAVRFRPGAQQLRLGLNYRLGVDSAKSADAMAGPAPARDRQFRRARPDHFPRQYVAPFRAPYAGTNSLAPDQGRETGRHAFAGWRPWSGAELWVDPEIDQGFGLSSTRRGRRLSKRRGLQGRGHVPYAACSARSFARPSISAARPRRSTPISTSSAARRPPTAW